MAEPITYMGYQSPENRVDWAALSDKFSTELKDVEEKRQLERDTLDKMALDNTVLVSSYVPGKDQTLNEMVLRGIDDAKGKISNWNKDLKAGKLKPSEYKTRMNNIKEYWGVMANNAKSYDQRIADVVTRQQEGTSGVMEAELLKQWENSTDVKSNAVVVGDDGRVYTSKFDRTTGQPTGQVTDMRLMSLPENVKADKIDLNTEIENYTADWEPVTMFAKEGDIDISSTSVKNQPNYKLMKEKVADAIAPDTNPRAQVSVLGDNGAYDVTFYYNDDEYNQRYDELLAKLEADKEILGEKITQEELDNIDNSLIRMGIDENNMMNPILTDKQKKAVKDYISNQIDIRTEDKIDRDISPEYKIAMQNEKLSIQQKRLLNSQTNKSSSGGGSDKLTGADYLQAGTDEAKQMFNKFTASSAANLTRWLKPGYKLKLENGKYSLYKLEDAAYDENADALDEAPKKTWKLQMYNITKWGDISDKVDFGGIQKAKTSKSPLFGELDNK
jgi:hypothetical protein